MKSNIVAASILGVSLVIAAALWGGRYYFFRAGDCIIVTGDRWTGKIDTVVASPRCVFDTQFSN